MKKVYLCLFGIAILILENSITNYMSIFGVTVDFILIFLTIISLYMDELESSIIGCYNRSNKRYNCGRNIWNKCINLLLNMLYS